MDRGKEEGQESPGLPLLLVVEGAADVGFLKALSALLHRQDPQLPDLAQLEVQRRLLFLPVGGSNVKDMAPRIASLNKRMLVLLDREVEPETSERHKVIAWLNRREGCVALLTRKRTLENYLHPAAIMEACGIDLVFNDDTDVAGLLARQLLARSGRQAWAGLSCRTQKRLRQEAKKVLNGKAVECMTPGLLAQQDPENEVIGWLHAIAHLLHLNS